MSALVFQGSPASVDLLRQGQSFLPVGDQTAIVVDAAITANSIVVATLGSLGSGAVSAQTGLVVQPLIGTNFTIRLAAVAAATGQYVNWAVLKY